MRNNGEKCIFPNPPPNRVLCGEMAGYCFRRINIQPRIACKVKAVLLKLSGAERTTTAGEFTIATSFSAFFSLNHNKDILIKSVILILGLGNFSILWFSGI
jgi:hypothetical protein